MKILQLTHKPPFPTIDGGCLAMNHITTCLLNAKCDVTVLAIETPKHKVIQSEEFQKYKQLTHFQSVFIDTNALFFPLIRSFFKKKSFQTTRFISKKMERKIAETLLNSAFDVIILESIFVGNYINLIRKYSSAKIILRQHNIEYKIWERLKQQTKNPIKKLIYNRLANSLQKFEFSLFSQIDAYFAITDVDYKFFNAQFPSVKGAVIPFGIELQNYPIKEPLKSKSELSLFHLGSMNWQPNVEGVEWFIKNVWEKIAFKYPQLKLILAGKNNKQILGHKAEKNLIVYDFVDDAQRFINEHDIMIVPLLSGSGMRIKILEGMALGKPIITTSIGAEGIDVVHGENIFIANTPAEIMETIALCIETPEKCRQVGKNARVFVQQYYDNKIITQKLMEAIEKTLLDGNKNYSN